MKKACKKAWIIWVVITLSLVLLLASCDGFTDPPEALKVSKSTYDPELTLSGDVTEKVLVNVREQCERSPSGRYALQDVLNFAELPKDIKTIMIFSRSTRGIGINVECVPYYYFTINQRGVISLNSDLAFHSMMGFFPLKGINEIMICAKNGLGNGVVAVDDKGSRSLGYYDLITSYGLYSRVRDIVYSDESVPLHLGLYNKNVESASILTKSAASCVAILEDDTKVLLTDNSRYSVHWANGSLYLVEFVSPIKTLDYRAQSVVFAQQEQAQNQE